MRAGISDVVLEGGMIHVGSLREGGREGGREGAREGWVKDVRADISNIILEKRVVDVGGLEREGGKEGGREG